MSSEPVQTDSELRRVLALLAGTVVYIVCMILVILLADHLFDPAAVAEYRVSNVWIAAWGFGGLVAATLAIEATKRVAPGFNRVGLAAILVILIVLFGGAVFLGLSATGSDIVQAFGPILALIGTIVGLARELPGVRKKVG